jgi:hypothetical protein
MTTSPFEFSDSFDTDALEGSFVLKVPTDIQSKRELLDVLARAGRFPGHFGRNWDALTDCLRDFEWISEKQIVIVHSDVPLRADPIECRTYLEILREATGDWTRTASPSTDAIRRFEFPDHTLRVLFPDSERGTVADMLAS